MGKHECDELRGWECGESSLTVRAQLAQGQEGLAGAVATVELAVVWDQLEAKTSCGNLLQRGNGGE